MAIICRDARILFIMAPRTGCSAIGRTLREELGGEFLPHSAVTDTRGKVLLTPKHNTLEQLLGAGLLTGKEADSFFKFAGVRNPFDSLVSLYMKKKYKYQKNLADPNSWVHRDPAYVEDMHFCRDYSFDQWVARHYRRSTLRRLLGRGHRSMYQRFTQRMDFVVRFEHLGRDFSEALQRAGVTRPIELRTVNVTDKRRLGYRSHYSDASRRAVQQTFHADLQQYGYCF